MVAIIRILLYALPTYLDWEKEHGQSKNKGQQPHLPSLLWKLWGMRAPNGATLNLNLLMTNLQLLTVCPKVIKEHHMKRTPGLILATTQSADKRTGGSILILRVVLLFLGYLLRQIHPHGLPKGLPTWP